MPIPIHSTRCRITTLREIHWGTQRPESTMIRTKPWGLPQARRERDIIHHPICGPYDDHDRSGYYYSYPRTAKNIPGRSPHPHRLAGVRKAFIANGRRFRYKPAIPWEQNEAFWDDAVEIKIEF